MFGRNQYMNSVIINTNQMYLGKLINVKINKSNQNTLFGTVENKKNIRAA